MSHRSGCTFGPGFYRIVLSDGARRFCQDEREVVFACSLLREGAIRKVQRDGYCLDQSDLESPHVLDGERFLHMPQRDAMRELGGVSVEEYAQAYRAVEDAVLARDRAIASGATDRPSIVIKKKGREVSDV